MYKTFKVVLDKRKHDAHKEEVWPQKQVVMEVNASLFQFAFFSLMVMKIDFCIIDRPLSVDHFNQNGNIKNISHIDADLHAENENDENIQKAIQCAELVNEKVSLEKSDIELAARKSQPIDKKDTTVAEKVDEYDRFYLFRFPCHKRIWQQVLWIIIWPMELLFFLTIPNCEKERFKKLFPFTFLMCIVWIGSLSYLVAWMITIVGKMQIEISRLTSNQIGISID